MNILRILLLAALTGCARQYQLDCVYQDAGGELAPHAGCAAPGLHMADPHLQQLDFDQHGLAPVLIAGQWHYFRRDGRHAAVISYDNGADSFAEGLVRSLRGRRIGYLDHQLNEVIAADYDWGWPFAGGRALVCRGCYQSPPDADGHVAVTGGLWGYIDRSGREVVPVRFTRDALPAP